MSEAVREAADQGVSTAVAPTQVSRKLDSHARRMSALTERINCVEESITSILFELGGGRPVHDYRNEYGELDPQSEEYVFGEYSAGPLLADSIVLQQTVTQVAALVNELGESAERLNDVFAAEDKLPSSLTQTRQEAVALWEHVRRIEGLVQSLHEDTVQTTLEKVLFDDVKDALDQIARMDIISLKTHLDTIVGEITDALRLRKIDRSGLELLRKIDETALTTTTACEKVCVAAAANALTNAEIRKIEQSLNSLCVAFRALDESGIGDIAALRAQRQNMSGLYERLRAIPEPVHTPTTEALAVLTECLAVINPVAARLQAAPSRAITCFPAQLTAVDCGWRARPGGSLAVYELGVIPPGTTYLQLFARDRERLVIARAECTQERPFQSGQWVTFSIDAQVGEVFEVRLQALCSPHS